MIPTTVLLNLVYAFLIASSSFFLASFLCKTIRLKKTLISLPLLYITHLSFLYYSIDRINFLYYPWYFLFLFLVSVTLYTDAISMCISRFFTLYPLPFTLSCSALFSLIHKGYLLPLSFINSVIGMLLGYSVGKAIAYFGKKYAQQEALGQGDIDLLILIGFFLGGDGVFKTLCYGSIVGSLYGILYSYSMYRTYNTNLRLPFGTFLTYGVFIYLICA